MSLATASTTIAHHSGHLELPEANATADTQADSRVNVTPERAEATGDEVLPESEVATEAYLLFEARGGEHGHDVDDWLAAEAIVRQRRGR